LIFRNKNRVQIITSTQYGKLIANDVPVWTNKGWKKHGELKVGDYVFNHLGKRVKIIVIGEKQFANKEVIFTNGEKIKCHENHEWIVWNENWDEYKVIQTNEIEKYKIIMSIPKVKPLEGKGELDIDPYFLGAWLGDGTSKKPSITIHPNDKDIIDRIPYKLSAVHIHKITGIKTFEFYKNGLLDRLRENNLYNNKHIPLKYKLASLKDRLELLAGLIDTDGSVNKDYREKGWKNGRVYIINTNKILIDDVRDIIHGLGIRTSITKVKACKSSSGIQGKKDVYYLGFQPNINIPTVLLRKKVNYRESKRSIRIKEIIDIESESGNCIQVEGGIYLVGKTMIPTHNSLITALACLVISCIQKELVAVVAPNKEKAKIIMRYYIEHLSDNPVFWSQLEKNTKLERLRQEESKERIILNNEGGIFVVSAQAGNAVKGVESAMGEGAKIVIQDESCLIPDQTESSIYRMIAGYKDGFYCKIGNPFYRNHFLKSWRSEKYQKIFIDYFQGLKEGRYTQEFIEEAKKKPNFDILFGCKFPDADMIDQKGYSVLLAESDIKQGEVNPFGEIRMGVDVAEGGGNYNVIVLRWDNTAKVVLKYQSENTMDLVGRIIQIGNEYDILPDNIFVDSIGVGKGVCDRLEENYNKKVRTINGVKVSEKAQDSKLYFNKRAENYWRLRQWIKQGAILEPNNDWNQLEDIKYKVKDSSGQLLIMPKDEMRKEGYESPDIADALMLTFSRIDFSGGKVVTNRVKPPSTYKKR